MNNKQVKISSKLLKELGDITNPVSFLLPYADEVIKEVYEDIRIWMVSADVSYSIFFSWQLGMMQAQMLNLVRSHS